MTSARLLGAPMSRRGLGILALLIAAGIAVRLVLLAGSTGQPFDIQSYRIAGDVLRTDGLMVYRTLVERLDDPGDPIIRWPYPPLFFGWILVARTLGRVGIGFEAAIKLPMVVADIVLVLAVVHLLGLRAASERTRLVAAGLVALGPSFFFVSGYHGQLDSVAIAPAVLAFVAWQRCSERRRSVVAGLLIGVGAALKTMPGLMVLALLPHARDRAERIRLVVASLAIPFVVLLPFVLAAPVETVSALGYGGAPGAGGWSLLVQPESADRLLLGGALERSALTELVWRLAPVIVGLALVAVSVLLFARRPAPADAAVLIWLAVFAASPNFFYQYLVWAIPFFLVAGLLRSSAALQAWMVLPTLAILNRPLTLEWAGGAYWVAMVAVWIAFVVAFVRRSMSASRQPGT